MRVTREIQKTRSDVSASFLGVSIGSVLNEKGPACGAVTLTEAPHLAQRRVDI